MVTKMEMVKNILSDMEYDENIRSGIWKHKSDEYTDFFHFAHGEMLPDDIRYHMIHSILCAMSEYNDLEDIDEIEMLDSLVPVYTHDLMEWLGSSNSRYSYTDDAVSEHEHGESIINDISMGYLFELEEVYNLINEWIDDNTEE